MHNLATMAIASGLVFSFSSVHALHAKDLTSQALDIRLEHALNTANNSALDLFLFENDNLGLKNRYKDFANRFPNAKWTVDKSTLLKDGRTLLNIGITGTRESGGNKYFLKSQQQLAVKTNAGRIINQEILSEYSILRNSQKPLQIELGIPDVVLTGTRYDIDLVLKEPLGDAIVAGGLINITEQQILSETNPYIEIKPMGGGGLFKSVQAPLKPGSQTWAAMLAHPDGLIMVTKRVRIISNEDEKNP